MQVREQRRPVARFNIPHLHRPDIAVGFSPVRKPKQGRQVGRANLNVVLNQHHSVKPLVIKQLPPGGNQLTAHAKIFAPSNDGVERDPAGLNHLAKSVLLAAHAAVEIVVKFDFTVEDLRTLSQGAEHAFEMVGATKTKGRHGGAHASLTPRSFMSVMLNRAALGSRLERGGSWSPLMHYPEKGLALYEDVSLASSPSD